MKRIKLSQLISQLEKLKDTKGDLEVYPAFHDEFGDGLHLIKRINVMSQPECERYKGMNVAEHAPKTVMFLVFVEE